MLHVNNILNAIEIFGSVARSFFFQVYNAKLIRYIYIELDNDADFKCNFNVFSSNKSMRLISQLFMRYIFKF